MNNYWNGVNYRERDSLTGTLRPTYFASDKVVTVAPVGQVVTAAIIKLAAPSYNQANDSFIDLIIDAVTDQIEQYLNRSLLTRTYKAIYYVPASMVYINPVPVGSITLVRSLIADGSATTLVLNQDYYVRGLKDSFEIYDINLRGGRYLEVTYTAGYGTANDVPAAIRMAIVQEVMRQFKNRQDADASGAKVMDSLSVEAQNLLRSYVARSVF